MFTPILPTFLAALALVQRDPLFLFRLAPMLLWTRLSLRMQHFAALLSILPSSAALHFDVLSTISVILTVPCAVDYSSSETLAWGLGVVVVCGAVAQTQGELLLVACAVALAVYACAVRERMRGVDQEVRKMAEEISALKKEEEALRTQFNFQKFQKRPLTSRTARALLSKIKGTTRPTLGVSTDQVFPRFRSEDLDEAPMQHSSTDLMTFDFDTEGDGEVKLESSGSQVSIDFSKAEFSSDDIEYLITSVMTRDFMKWSDQQQKAIADVLSARLDLRNTLSQKLHETVGASHKIFTPTIKRVRRITGVLQENAEFSVFLSSVGEWNFDTLGTLRFTSEPLKEVGFTTFHAYSLLETFEITKETLLGFLTRVEQKYRSDNYYHNSLHAADVLNSAVFLMMSKLYRCGQFLELEVFGLLTAAIGHDVGHPGVNNTYLIHCQDQLALKYNDRSVLEHMHSALTFQILEKQDSCIVSSLTSPSFMMFRKIVITLILGTDLQKHMSKLKEFEAALADDTKDLSNNDFRLMLLEMCLKCADLGHGAKDINIHKRWSALITKEFFHQGDLEKSQNLPISPICNRDTAVVSDSQIGFLTFLVLPIFDVWERMVQKLLGADSTEVHICSQQTRSNIQFWKDELARFRSGVPTFVIDSQPPPLARLERSSRK